MYVYKPHLLYLFTDRPGCIHLVGLQPPNKGPFWTYFEVAVCYCLHYDPLFII